MAAFTLRVEAAASIGRKKYDPPPAAVWGLKRKATRVSSGAKSLSNSTHFPVIEDSKLVNPVTLPPGREKLATKPSPMGSDTTDRTADYAHRSGRQARTERSPAPDASDRPAPKRCATQPAARQRRRPDAEIVGGEVSF